MRKGWALAICCLAAWAGMAAPAPALELRDPWPEPSWERSGEAVTYPSRSPFALADVGEGAEAEPATAARATYFAPTGVPAGERAPAAILLHGAGGVLAARELQYGRQLSAMGVAVLAVDAFGARAGWASGFADRLIQITETMLLADAFAGLDFLAARPEVDARRVVLIGFSYGGMAATYAAYAQVAERFRPDGRRFAGHVAFYAPCVARFEDHRATGAPVLMLYGEKDAIIDRARCGQVAADLRSGGARVEMIAFANAYHQWDGSFSGPRRIGRNLAPCRFRVDREGYAREDWSGLAMTGPFRRRLILAACTDGEGYLIGRDDAVRARSNAALGRFLARVFGE